MTPHEPDFSKLKFTITIDVFENGQSITITHVGDKTKHSYQEIIGALEIQKAMYLYDQSVYNRKKFDEAKEKPKEVCDGGHCDNGDGYCMFCAKKL